MSLAAIDFSAGTIVTIALSVIGAIALLSATFFYQFWKAWQKFSTRDADAEHRKTREDCDRRERIVREDSEIRESLLSRYKEMYEVEKQQSANDLREIEQKLTQLKQDQDDLERRYRELHEDYEQMKAEYDKIVALNIAYQQAAVASAAEIQRLRAGR